MLRSRSLSGGRCILPTNHHRAVPLVGYTKETRFYACSTTHHYEHHHNTKNDSPPLLSFSKLSNVTPPLPPNYQLFKDALNHVVDPKRIVTDPLRTFAYGTDASLYRLVPKIVINVASESEVVRIMRLASEHNTPLTFRAAGTSLSGNFTSLVKSLIKVSLQGQAITDSVLVRLVPSAWQRYKFLAKDASVISLEPGLIGGQVNRILGRAKIVKQI